MPEKLPALLRPVDVEQHYGLAVQWLATMRCERRGPSYVKLGSSRTSPVFYRVAEVERWLSENTVSTRDGAA